MDAEFERLLDDYFGARYAVLTQGPGGVEWLKVSEARLVAYVEGKDKEIEAAELKIAALAKHTCACSIDGPDDICMHHSPKLLATTERLSTLEAKARAVVEESAHVRYCDAICGPPDESWIENDLCDCAVNGLKEALGHE